MGCDRAEWTAGYGTTLAGGTGFEWHRMVQEGTDVEVTLVSQPRSSLFDRQQATSCCR